MQTGERALAVAFLNQVLSDFTAGCEMFTTARKSIESKGKLPGSYHSINAEFNRSVNFLIPKDSFGRKYLTVWADLAGSDADVLSQKFKTLIKGEGKLEGKPYYEHIRDQWICEAYMYNSDLLNDIDEMNKYKKLKIKQKKYEECEKLVQSKLKTVEKRILDLETKKLQYKDLLQHQQILDKDLLKEKIQDCDLLIKIYKTKSTGYKGARFRQPKEIIENEN